ncbi:MAG: sigma-70 family RNA polymerase sigma factor [bacterium]
MTRPAPLRSQPKASPGDRRRQLEALEDAELVHLCAQRDELAWATLVARFRRLVYAIPVRASLGEDETEHVFHETFAKLAERIGQLKEPHRVRAWLVTTARRLTIDIIRSRTSKPRVADSETVLENLEDPKTLAPDDLARLETRHLVRQALMRLGDRCRRLLTVLFYDDSDPPRSYESIAKELDMPVGSLGPTRARCLVKLAAELEDLRR